MSVKMPVLLMEARNVNERKLGWDGLILTVFVQQDIIPDIYEPRFKMLYPG